MGDLKRAWQNQNSQARRFLPNNKKRRFENRKPILECPTCGKNHELKDCFIANKAYFSCGEKGHVIANCPKRLAASNQGRGKGPMRGPLPKTQDRVFALTREQANNATDVVQGSRLT